jgi:hypothetical protein
LLLRLAGGTGGIRLDMVQPPNVARRWTKMPAGRCYVLPERTLATRRPSRARTAFIAVGAVGPDLFKQPLAASSAGKMMSPRHIVAQGEIDVRQIQALKSPGRTT